MTTPESITVSLDYAKKLKEAGWPQDDALFGHFSVKPDREKDMMVMTMDEYNEFKHLRMEFFVAAAPTAEELLRTLPWPLETGSNGKCIWAVTPYGDGYKVEFLSEDDRVFANRIEDTVANAAAAMYCYLAEQSLLPEAA